MFKIGCHLPIANGFLKAGETIIELGGNTFQYFSRNPQGGQARAWNEDDFQKFMLYAKKAGIENLLCHAPYTLNACSANPQTRDFAKLIFQSDIQMLEHFPNPLYNFHPGSHTNQGVEVGIFQIIEILNEVIYPKMKTTILLETMSGKGSEIGRNFEEIRKIIQGVKYNEKIGVCLDTCHVYSAGYDIVNHLDDVLKEFDDIIGLDRLKAIHLNDSLVPFESNKDRHAKIGQGTLGLEAIIRIINHPKLKHLPFYLETPNDELGYKEEIKMLKKYRV